MRAKNLTIAAVLFGLIWSLTFNPCLFAQEKEDVIYIPKEVKKILKEGMDAKQGRLDIPFSLFKHIYLPARDSVHSIFFFKIKNSDLGYAPIAPSDEEKKKDKKTEAEEQTAEIQAGKLQTKSHLFLQFNQLDSDMEKEVYVPVEFQLDEASYNPEEEVVCTTGFPLRPGKYLLSMAITSWDLKTIGTQYYEFTLPDAADYKDKIDTTPIFFVKNLQQMPQPEMKAAVHRDFFTYSVLQITPNLENAFKVGQNLDIFFYIFGAEPKPDGNYDIEATFQVIQEEKPIIKFAGTKYNNPIISQPLPLKKTVVVETGEGDEKTTTKQTKDLEPGRYILSIELKCNVSGKSVIKTIDFSFESN